MFVASHTQQGLEELDYAKRRQQIRKKETLQGQRHGSTAPNKDNA